MCDKILYRTEKEANTAKNTIKRHVRTRNSTDIPKRAYWCNGCKGFHLTSLLKP